MPQRVQTSTGAEHQGAAAQFRVGGDGGLAVAGHVDFGDDGDVPLGRVGDDLAEVVLGVVAAVRQAVEHAVHAGDREDGFAPPRADLGEPRVALDLDPPALVVGEVQVQDVELVRGQQVDEAQHVVLGHEVPGDVEHAAPRQPKRGASSNVTSGHGHADAAERAPRRYARGRSSCRRVCAP